MRPERFRYEMNKAFDRWFEDLNVEEFKPLLREMKRAWKKKAKAENDHRTGEETYGYADNKSIYNDMLYISDRWNCAFRLKWLIDGLEYNKIKSQQ